MKKGYLRNVVNESYVKRHPILDDKDRLEDILHDLQIIAYKKYISEEGRKNLLAAQDLVAKAADEAQRTISQTNLYPTRNKLPWNK